MVDNHADSYPLWRGVVVIIGGILLHMTLGTVYTFGNMNPYMTSYLRERKISPTLTAAESIWIFAVAAMGQGSTVFVGGFIHRKLGTRLTILLGGWISSGGVALTYFTIKKSFVLTAVTYGAMFGLGVGIAYAIPMASAMKWLPGRQGLVNGLVIAGFGSGAFVFDLIQTAYLNPSNLSPDKSENNEKYFTQSEVLDRVPSCFLVLGAIYAGIQLFAVLLISDPPIKNTKLNSTLEGEEEALISKEIVDDSTTEKRNFTPRQILREKSFYILWFLFLFNGQGIQFISGLYKTFGETFIKDDHFLATVGSIAAVCNGGGRILWGILADKFSFKVAAMCSSGIFCALMLTFLTTEEAGKGLYLVYVGLSFLCFSGNFSLMPTACAKTFGQKHYAINYGFIFTASIVTSPIGVILTSKLQNILGWSGMFFLVSGFSFISVVLAWLFNVKRPDGRDI